MDTRSGTDGYVNGRGDNTAKRFGMFALLGLSFLGAGISALITAPVLIMSRLDAFKRWEHRRLEELRESVRKRHV